MNKEKLLCLTVIMVLVCWLPAKALLPEWQFFSTVTGYGPCSKVCYDPGDGAPTLVTWNWTTCGFGFSGCAVVSCSLSCRQLLQLGLY